MLLRKALVLAPPLLLKQLYRAKLTEGYVEDCIGEVDGGDRVSVSGAALLPLVVVQAEAEDRRAGERSGPQPRHQQRSAYHVVRHLLTEKYKMR